MRSVSSPLEKPPSASRKSTSMKFKIDELRLRAGDATANEEHRETAVKRTVRRIVR